MAMRSSTVEGHGTGPRTTPVPASSSAAAKRIRGIDMARALAIIGMLAVHIGPTGAEGVSGDLYALTHGRASILFMLVAGVGVALLARSQAYSQAQGREASWRQTAGQLAWRALLLLPAGLGLQMLDHGVLVILQQYGLMFLMAIAVFALRDHWLLLLAAASAVFGSLGFLVGRELAPETFNRAAVAFGDSPGEILHGLVLSGPYPLIVWAAPFLLGMWLGRRRLQALRVQAILALGGGATAALAAALAWTLGNAVGEPEGWLTIVTNTPHSQMPLWILGSTGSAAMVLGLSLLAANRFGRAVWPLVAMGQLALTVYVAHLFALHYWRDAITSDNVGVASLIVLGLSAGAAVATMLWRL
ncbi:MAG: acyltransferase family protein, partial [Dehalococcoidia bacterium]